MPKKHGCATNMVFHPGRIGAVLSNHDRITGSERAKSDRTGKAGLEEAACFVAAIGEVPFIAWTRRPANAPACKPAMKMKSGRSSKPGTRPKEGTVSTNIYLRRLLNFPYKKPD